MKSTEPKYWFPAKRYGWGWGVPTAWQGWVFLVGWLAVVLWVNRFSVPHRIPQHLLLIIAMIALLLLVCYWKGEPPKWRWGDTNSK